MRKLLCKEFRLVVQPFNYLFLAFALMMLIPNYPLYVTFFYETLGLFMMFMTGKINNDVMFSALLPVRKGDVVRARCLTSAILELMFVAATVPVTVLRGALYAGTPVEKSAFTEPNAASYGIALMLLAAFNAMFIPAFYKTAYKVKFLWVSIVMFVLIFAAETFAFIPATAKYIDATDLTSQIRQLPVLAAGIAVFAGGMALTCRRSIRNFERVDL